MSKLGQLKARIETLELQVERLEKAGDEGFYDVWLDCANCRVAVLVKIPRGTSVKQYRQDAGHSCPKCGCKFAK